MRMGEKEVVNLAGLNGELVEGEFWVMTICLATVHKDIYAVG